MSLKWLNREFKDISIEPLEPFLGDKTSSLTVETANSAGVEVRGTVTFDFGILNFDFKFTIPFIITNHNLASPIILVKENSNDVNPIFEHFPEFNTLNASVAFI